MCMTREEATAAVSSLFDELQATSVVVEEFMEGVEASF
ncbi:MAG: hypothetical protein EBZ48_11270, partial [Proteobacteria bacterium]|nr:hypothetical protein [Pseudomonadota bacterium]